MEDHLEWLSTFKKELDTSSYELIKNRLAANQFTSRTKLKLVHEREIDLMFDKDLSLGTKRLLMYQIEKLRNESPLPLPRENLPEKPRKLQDNECAPSTGTARKAVLPAFEEQKKKLRSQLAVERDDAREIQIKIDSMTISVREREAVGISKVICSNCHTRGHRNQQSKPCIFSKCTDYTFCGLKDKHPEYFSRLNSLKLELKRKNNTITELEDQLKSMDDFASNSEFHFIQNLTPRLYEVDVSYKQNKAKLMRDIRMLRTCLDGKIPPVTANDSEQLRILISKCKKNIKLDPEAPSINPYHRAQSQNLNAQQGEDFMVVSPIKVNQQELESDKKSVGHKHKKSKKRTKKHRKKKRDYSSSSSASSSTSSDEDMLNNKPRKKQAGYFMPPPYLHPSFLFGGYPTSYPPNSPWYNNSTGYFPSPQPAPFIPNLPAAEGLQFPQEVSNDNTRNYNSQFGFTVSPQVPISATSTTTNTTNTATSCGDVSWSALDTLVQVANDESEKNQFK